MREINWLAVIMAVVTTLGCNAEKAEPAAGEKKATTKPKTAPPGEPIVVPALAFGPYTASEPPSGAAVFVELGYFDRRETKGTGDADVFDRRDRHVAVAALPGSAAQTAGCAPVEVVAATAGDLAPRIAGDADIELDADDDGVWRHEDDAETSDFAVDGEHTVTYEEGGDVKEAALPDVPSYTGLQMAGAFDANLTINTNVSDINEALADSDAEVLFGDAGTGDGYDVAVVILHGGSDAAAAGIRCVFAAGGSATLPAADYRQVLPVRRITGLVAKLGGGEDGGADWVARFAGQSTEDLRVP
jgi:hypothetical protein